jgi:hypothetical protein
MHANAGANARVPSSIDSSRGRDAKKNGAVVFDDCAVNPADRARGGGVRRPAAFSMQGM